MNKVFFFLGIICIVLGVVLYFKFFNNDLFC